jgi:glycerophosphoryl diester phosphodiesterase
MTRIIAHRGASFAAPENSMEAFQRAIDMGADGIELDVHTSRDGELVVIHNAKVMGRPIHRLTVVDIMQHVKLPNGETPPILGDVLNKFGDLTTMYIEVKSLNAACDDALLDAIEQSPRPAECHVHAFDHRIVKRLLDAAPELKAGALSSSYPIDAVRPLRDCGATTLWQYQNHVDGELTAAVHEAGCEVFAWTVDDPDRMEKLRACGVDAVCTNAPDVARRVIR